MKVLLVAPPRLLWPYMNEQDNFLLPQGLPSLAAVLRADGADVEVIDCPPQKVGWASLEERIRKTRPDVVGAGENHAIYAREVIRLVETVKRVDPRIYTVLGGAHFTNLPEMYLPKAPHRLHRPRRGRDHVSRAGAGAGAGRPGRGPEGGRHRLPAGRRGGRHEAPGAD